ncbi:PaaI family thioesterase [Aquipseudomonas ullengensis]|uniref:PaaI family thioesterase n=1 Tax=Aquipseudomonas ullengensis TaxID=2759166 RepID=A0A7W4LQA7_9GAMM|nr:PaaI family thioesterase [Pseudomonas ullengensis]MBB2497380.1 PaaI family thioesterase [Pseudomonas ullengensis]
MSGRNVQEVSAYAASVPPLQGMDPFLTHLAIYGTPEFDEEGATLRLRLKDHHMNGGASAHGGLLMTLMDVVLACCTLGHGSGRSCVTVELKTTFMRPGGISGNLLVARGFLRSSGKSLAFCDGEVRNEAGELLATASGTFKYVNRKTPAA